MGCVGLAAFAVIVWQELPRHSAPVVIAEASVAWAVVSFAVWWLWRKRAAIRRRSS
jgi:hypothetical protein